MREPRDYNILIVDDDVSNQQYYGRLLAQHGFTDVQRATDGLEMSRRLETSPPDLVLLDLHLPGRDGFSLLEDLRGQQRAELFLPIIVITSDPTPEAKQRALSLGASDFLMRPFDPHELLLRLRNLLGQRDMHRQIIEANRVLGDQLALGESELRRAHAEMLVRLARAAEYRDDQTGQHTWRVGHIARLVAVELGETQRFVDLMGLAARLHDVGKIGVPDAVLLKPARLDESEFAVMRSHTTIGARLLAGGNTALMKMAESIALNHHEAWDGSGYPNGVAGEAIPREGRIVAVADVFDALTHTRSYKPRWPVAKAIAELERVKGSQLEPGVVDAFMRVHRNGGTADAEVPQDEEEEIARVTLARH